MPTSPTTASVARYELLARELERQIADGVLRPGDRLPSVRQTRSSRGLSPSTVFQAYYLLESRGLIRAVPRSGYFVAARADGVLLAEPRTTEPQAGSRTVEVNDLVCEILGSARARDIVPFARELDPRTVRMMLSAAADFSAVLAAVNLAGVFSYIPKPWSDPQLLADLRAALVFDPGATPSADELERRRLEALEPGITQVEWGPNGEVLMPGNLLTRPGKL